MYESGIYVIVVLRKHRRIIRRNILISTVRYGVLVSGRKRCGIIERMCEIRFCNKRAPPIIHIHNIFFSRFGIVDILIVASVVIRRQCSNALYLERVSVVEIVAEKQVKRW